MGKYPHAGEAIGDGHSVPKEGVMSQYRDLEVWKRSVKLVGTLYRLTSHFPKSEKFGITDQIRRSASSVPANIAEGYGRLTDGDYLRFLSIARGSLFELETHLYIAIEVGLLSESECGMFFDEIQQIGRMMTGLIHSVQRKQPKHIREHETDYVIADRENF